MNKEIEMNDKPVTINSVEALEEFAAPTEPDADVVEQVARVIMGALGCETVTDSSDCINCDSTYGCEHVDFDYCETHDEVAAVGAPCPTAAKAALATLSATPPSDAEAKLAAVRELCAHEMERTDRTSVSTYTDGVKVGQAAMAEAVLALLDGEATS